jgi:endoglucanase
VDFLRETMAPWVASIAFSYRVDRQVAVGILPDARGAVPCELGLRGSCSNVRNVTKADRSWAIVGAFLLVLSVAGFSAGASAGVADGGPATAPGGDPLAGMRWGTYSGPQDEVFPAYRSASGQSRRLLGLIALRPRVRWFGAWYSDAQIESAVREYIANVTGGQPDVLAQMAVFRLVPWEQAACQRLPDAAERASYERWIRAFAAGIGSARVALILQPDLPFALCTPNHSALPLRLVADAARRFSALPHATVYIDVGAADWPTAAQAARLLAAAGVRYARGFALDATHYDSTARQISFGADVARRLGKDGIPGRHFVVNTAQNGQPFTYRQYHGRDYDNAPACRRRAAHRCVTLGIPPTWRVADPRWGLSSSARVLAAKLVDAYLWIGRPWLVNQADPFDLSRALALARTTPF